MSPYIFTRRKLLATIPAMLPFAASAQSFPSRPIRVVVPYPAGGSTDQLARAIQQPLAELLGQPLFIDNKAGASGAIGTDAVVKAPADGYTLVFGNTGPNAVIQLLTKVPYDPVRDLRPISTVALTPMILAVPADSPARTVKEFLSYARQQDGALNYGSVGIGSLSHLTGELFNDMANLKIQHIPYSGGAPMLSAFAGGQLHAAFVTGLDGASLLASGKVRYLGVATPQRTDIVPGLPAIAEEIPGFSSTAWFGILGPRGLSDDLLARLNSAVVAAVSRPDVRKLFSDRRIEARSSTPLEMERRIADEMQKWGQVIRKSGIIP